MMRVEVDGIVVRRPGVLDVLQYDSKGNAVLSHLRPQLLPGEVLVERVGAIPAVIGARPRHEHDVTRHQVVRAVLGTHPAMLAEEADPVALNCIVHSLMDAAEAKRLLCANTPAWPAQTLTAMVRGVLNLEDEPHA
jgi:hypothetical protein